MENIKNIFKNYRKRNNLTQKELSIILNCSLQSIAKAESGRYSIGKKTINSLLSQKDITKEEKEILLKYRYKNKKVIISNTKLDKINLKNKAFDSNLETRTLLITKIWDFNDTMFEKWRDVSLLLDIIDKVESKKMKKGILSISKNLKELAEKMEKSIQEDEIIVEVE